ncbi:putative glutamine/gamma-aminobutyrate antiporter GadC [Cellulosimicrobium sp. SH8]|uniref:putative glutamine/gamma-aminobutyrate antiporter GadC n=1 Tax=Cellulosimicrobium sp. SH8 TaxID=2952936 RepID=UPI0021F2D239|nr:putative glutamine/gamma-aminobutyrate antiporter GadC [Cellulosimicrobium sp. SH8]
MARTDIPQRPARPAAATITATSLVMLNVAAVVSLRGLPAEAEYGLSSAFYYLLAAVCFLAPVAIVAAELASTWPAEGGMFRWVGEAFGSRWGFLAIAMVFVEGCIWFPTVLTFAAVTLAYTGPDARLDEQVADDRVFVLAIVLVVFWAATLIALRGASAFARTARWGGIVGTLVPAALLVGLGAAYLLSGEPSRTTLSWGAFVPDLTRFDNVVLAAGIFLFYAGIEVNAVHVGSIRRPERTYPVAILVAALVAVVVLTLGTLTIAVVVPQDDISLTTSLLQAFDHLLAWAGIPWAGPVVAAMLAVGVLAGVTTWVAGPATGLHAVARAGFLPRWFHRTNRRGMATNILLVQALVVTVLSVMFVVMPSVQSAYQLLSQLTVILYLVAYLLMFAAVVALRRSQPERPRPYRVPGGRPGVWVVGGVGFVASLLALVTSFAPPGQVAVGSPVTYVVLLVVLSVVFVVLPLLVYRARTPGWRDAESSFEPFTWQSTGATDDPPRRRAAPDRTAHDR